MSEIKFRAWDVELEEMYHDVMVSSSGWTSKDMHNGGLNRYTMQYTGLKDKNGKEVYEGDIMNTGGSLNLLVEWDNHKSGFLMNNLPIADFAQREVIGNIYENPELLTGDNP